MLSKFILYRYIRSGVLFKNTVILKGMICANINMSKFAF